MNTNDGPREPERPRSEPEIIPPARSGGRPDDGVRGEAGFGRGENVFVYVDAQGNPRRVNVKTVSPFVVVLVLLAVAIVAAAIFAVVLGALFFLIPLAALALAGLIGFAYARGLWRRVTGSAGSWRRG